MADSGAAGKGYNSSFEKIQSALWAVVNSRPAGVKIGLFEVRRGFLVIHNISREVWLLKIGWWIVGVIFFSRKDAKTQRGKEEDWFGLVELFGIKNFFDDLILDFRFFSFIYIFNVDQFSFSNMI